jgi:hypothetical protein
MASKQVLEASEISNSEQCNKGGSDFSFEKQKNLITPDLS